jgi:hypothetical protein
MTGAPERRRGAAQWILDRSPSTLAVMRIMVFLVVAMTVAFWVYFHLALERTIVVAAETGALEIELEAELSGKAFRNVRICKQRVAGEDDEEEDKEVEHIGCPSRTHLLSKPKRILKQVLPAGAKLEIISLRDAVRIDIVSLPDHYANSDVGRLEGGALVIEGLDTFGTLPLRGKAEIGALFSDTDRLSIISGQYRLRGYTPVGLLGGETRELRSGALLAGARVRFVDGNGETADGRVAIMLPDPKTPLMRVTAMSEHATSNLAVRYYFTEEVVLRPSFLEALILDPLLQLLVAILGAVAGYGWLKRPRL